ncbi:hypothetical protein QQG73_15365, partial [Listeria monocytogenes]
DVYKRQVEWCYEWNFTAGELGLWTENYGDGAELGVGWRGARNNVINGYEVDLSLGFAETTITGVSVEFSHAGTGTCWQRASLVEAGLHITVIDEVRAESPITVAWSGSMVVTGIRVWNQSADAFNGGQNAIRKVRIVGVGTNPFGDS